MTSVAFPRIFLLPHRLTESELADLRTKIPSITRNINDAEVVVGKVGTKQRAKFELRSRGIVVVEKASGATGSQQWPTRDESVLDNRSQDVPPLKRRRIDDPSQENFGFQEDLGNESKIHSELSRHTGTVLLERSQDEINENYEEENSQDILKVVKLDWVLESLDHGQLLPMNEYIIFQCERKKHEAAKGEIPSETIKEIRGLKDALLRAQNEAKPIVQSAHFNTHHYQRGQKLAGTGRQDHILPAMIRHTTSEDTAVLPVLPDYLKTPYSCERPTLANPPNADFIEQLKTIRHARVLRSDEVGVRAYSTCIASIAAYPYKLMYPNEILRLPGCDQKIGSLFQEWKDTGRLRAVEEIEEDAELKVLDIFWNIWDVGATMAREFYSRGWRDLDDVIEYGWPKLRRNQQIGVKYYDEFKMPISRGEVESIANKILEYACRIRPGFHMCIVGGYRKGKEACGDVDLILSHPDEEATKFFIPVLASALERTDHITHTLELSVSCSERNQIPAVRKGGTSHHSGFGTLDKALVVWQEPQNDPADGTLKNTNPHRRVDIIISPWKTAGCAVLAWSTGITFQRDLRRYCSKLKDWRFDSSGIRDLNNGSWIDIENPEYGWGPEDERLNSLEGKERLVFEALGLEYRAPNERETG